MAVGGWYYVEGDQRVGPVETAEINRLIQTGRAHGNTLVWRDGMDGWAAASDHFAVNAASPPPIPFGAMATSSAFRAQSEQVAVTRDGLYPGAPSRSFGEAIRVCFSQYAAFGGRASRSEFWFFTLFCFLVGFLVGLVTGFTEAARGAGDLSAINSIVSLALFLPSLAVSVRRLHDIGRTGWWIGAFLLVVVIVVTAAALTAESRVMSDAAIRMIAVIGIGLAIYYITMLVFYCQKGDAGPNRFG